MTRLRTLAAGVDTVHLSAKGDLKDGLTACFGHMQETARDARMPLPFSFRDPEQLEFLLRPHGAHGQPFWLSSPRFEVFFGAAPHFPQAMAQLHSPWIHTVGVEAAIAEVERSLRGDFFDGTVATTTSRIDVYADEQGWYPVRDDFDHFICRAVKRRMYEMPVELHASGRQLSGFVFGKGDVVARIYDKTLEMRTRGHTWLEEVWEGGTGDDAVWRIEVQFRRAALRAFGITALEHALHARQGLWEYGTTWLSLRRPTRHIDRDRWPEAREWTALRQTWIGSPRSLLVRERLRQADSRRLVQGLVGYATSLAAVEDHVALAGVVTREIPAAARYLRDRGERVEDIVERKRRLRLQAQTAAAR